MNAELEQSLKRDFHPWFEGLRDAPYFRSQGLPPPIACGIECGDGWYELLHNLCTALRLMDDMEDFRVLQVKAKYGTLRFYTNFGSPEINQMIDKAEVDSSKICEECGSRDNVATNGTLWIKTECSRCRLTLIA